LNIIANWNANIALKEEIKATRFTIENQMYFFYISGQQVQLTAHSGGIGNPGSWRRNEHWESRILIGFPGTHLGLLGTWFYERSPRPSMQKKPSN